MEAVLKEDWELVAGMVVDTENSATEFLQGKHVIDLTAPQGIPEGDGGALRRAPL